MKSPNATCPICGSTCILEDGRHDCETEMHAKMEINLNAGRYEFIKWPASGNVWVAVPVEEEK